MSQSKFTKVINEMESALDKNGNHLDMNSVIVSVGNDYFTHYFKPKTRTDIRSIAKPIACMAVGIAIDKGLYFDGNKIGLETPIWQFISKYATIKNHLNIEKWTKVKLLDLFRITLGHDKGLVFSSDVKEQGESDLVNYVVNYPITGEVGKDFVYSNAGTFLISSLITEYLGMNLDEFTYKHLFEPMGINDFHWRKYGKYTAGCTGLELQNEDLHKFGKLLLNNGAYNSKQLVPRDWIIKMKSPLVASPTHRYVESRAYPKWSYGMNLWICQDGNYFCDGTASQYLIVVPKKNTVITSTGQQADAEPVSRIFGAFK